MTAAETSSVPPGTPRAQQGERFHRWMRLVAKRDFEHAYRTGGRARGAWLTVVAAPNGLDRTRLGLSVGKRFWRRAVARNRVRRVLREAFRLDYAVLPDACDLILIPGARDGAPPLGEARAELVRLAGQARERVGRPRSRSDGRSTGGGARRGTNATQPRPAEERAEGTP